MTVNSPVYFNCNQPISEIRYSMIKVDNENFTFSIKDSLGEILFNFIQTPTMAKKISNKTYIDKTLDDLYNECKNNGWYEEEGLCAKGLSLDSINQARTFANYIDFSDKPNIVPYCDGTIGFEWHKNNALISITFAKPNEFSYAILTPENKSWGTKTQNINNQRQIIAEFKGILNNVRCASCN